MVSTDVPELVGLCRSLGRRKRRYLYILPAMCIRKKTC